jgi:Protein of unknown function (DUF2911)
MNERKDEVRAMRNVALGSVLALALTFPAAAQQLRLPAPSPAAKVSQEVGVTDISVEYSSPAVKGRKVWGELVPMDQVWRSGANAATKVTFSRDVTFGGKPVPAGTYALVTVPSAKGWTVALNKELGLWTGKQYDAKDDVVRVSATTAAVPHRERLAYIFSDTTDDGTRLDLEWEKLRISVPVKVDTRAQALASIQGATGGTWRVHANAARYLSETQKDHDAALQQADTAVALNPNWYTQWTRAEILARKGQYAEARKSAQAAWDLGQKEQNFFFKDQVSKALAEWKAK